MPAPMYVGELDIKANPCLQHNKKPDRFLKPARFLYNFIKFYLNIISISRTITRIRIIVISVPVSRSNEFSAA